MVAFTKAICFTDIHWGRRSDLEQHNDDCLRFIDWIIEQFHEHRCDAVIFMGDWFHNQVRVQWDTMWKSEQAIRKLSALDVPVYFCIGNHDMWFKHSRDIHSHAMLHWVKNFHVIDKPTQIDDYLFCPYLVGAESDVVAQTKARYVFGHFIFPGVLVNEGYEMPEGEGLNPEYFEGPEYVFSGHFHKRQWGTNSNGVNFIYIGNCFPHDFNDAGDRDRGCMIFDREAEPVFLNWNGPNFHYADLSEIIKMIENDHLMVAYSKLTTLHIQNDINLTDPDLSNLRDWLGQQGFREVRISPPYVQEEELPEHMQMIAPAHTENITEYFRSALNQVDTEGSRYDPAVLRNLFETAMEKHSNGEAL